MVVSLYFYHPFAALTRGTEVTEGFFAERFMPDALKMLFSVLSVSLW
jgi:hypothetical protein